MRKRTRNYKVNISVKEKTQRGETGQEYALIDQPTGFRLEP